MRAALYSDAHAVFAEIEMDAGVGEYTAPIGGPAVPTRVFRQQRFAALGTYRQLPIGATAFALFIADCAPAVDGILVIDAQSWRLTEEIDNDGYVSIWAVRRG